MDSTKSKAPQRRIGELLLDAGLVSEAQLKEALARQSVHGGKIAENLIALGYLDRTALMRFLAQQPGVASIDLSQYEISRDIIDLVPKEIAIQYEIFPIDRLGQLLTLGMAFPLDASSIDRIRDITGLRIKPLLCSPEDIRTAIHRYYPRDHDEAYEETGHPATVAKPKIESLTSSFKLANVATMVRQINALPALPETIQRVRDVMDNPRTSLTEVADIITMDPPVAAKVLSVANSAAYGFQNRIDDLSLAVTLMGLRETYTIVLSVAVVDLVEKSKHFDYKRFWVKSMCCAAAARVVARGAGRKNMVGLFASALLLDIGRYALSEIAPQLYARVDRNATGLTLVHEEEKLLGISHAEAGYQLAASWGLPEDICECIRFHHAIEHGQPSNRELLAVVNLADGLALAGATKYDSPEMVLENHRDALEVLDIDSETAKGLVTSFVQDRDETLREVLE